MRTTFISKQSDLEIDVEDSAQVILGFEDVDGAVLTASLNIDFIRHDTTRKCFVIGEMAHCYGME